MSGSLGQRARVAFRLGFAIFVAGAAILGGLALAHGPFVPPTLFGGTGASSLGWDRPDASAERSAAPEPLRRRARVSDDGNSGAKAKRAKAVSGSGYNVRYGNAVCVRLCDGAFFPAVDAAGGDAACQAQCPDAPVAFYSMPGDDIGMAVSLTGARYSSLPVANRQQTVSDNTCACRRAGGSLASAAWRRDHTLRKGDVIATFNGFVVFSGARERAGRFVALAKSSDLGRDRKAELSAMERVSAMANLDSPPIAPRSGSVQVSDSGAR